MPTFITLDNMLHLSWIVAIIILIRKRHEILETLKKLSWGWRIVIGAALIACAFIPGPVDDIIVLALIAKVGR
jgi:hypothetical protein